MKRAFTLVEVLMVAVVAAVVGAAAIAVTINTSNDLTNAQHRLGILDFIQRERNSHVNRAVENEIIVLCAASGAALCSGAGGDTMVAYRSPRPAVFPPTGAQPELARTAYPGTQITFTPAPALFVDAFARAVDAGGVPRNTVVDLQLRGTNDDIVFRADGVAIPSFDATATIEVTPIVSDLGSRTTPNPTPQSRPNTTYRARKVPVE
jgi:prepilin-type N-terminal cleavage/methylation domain-containing protein